MNLKTITAGLRTLPPARKMELADLLYDQAARELEAAAPAKLARGTVPGPAPTAGAYRPGPALDPWAGFSERLLGR